MKKFNEFKNENKIKIKLTEKFIEVLEKLPEQGMGYQIVDVFLKNGNLLKGKIVFNSTYLQLENSELIEPKDMQSL